MIIKQETAFDSNQVLKNVYVNVTYDDETIDCF
jgi:hypothetical protein